MILKNCLIFYVFLEVSCDIDLYGDSTIERNFDKGDTSSRVLSRTKRFLIFPDGSSLQLGKPGSFAIL